MANVLEDAARLIYLGETGHIESEDWIAWARDAKATMTELFQIPNVMFQAGLDGEISMSDAVENARPYTEARNRLEDVFNARNSAAVAWPIWGGPEHESARFDSRLLNA